MKKYFALFILILVASCKPKAFLAEGTASKTLSADKIISNHYSNKTDFSTLSIKASAKYQDDKQSQNVQAEIRIKKDEKILVSIRILGITMAKALITPTSVQYYEKIGSKYFEGDYVALSKWLGTDLDFQKVQNMFIGKAIDDLHKGNYAVSIMEILYKLQCNPDGNTDKTFFFESGNFLVKKQEINQVNFWQLMRDKKRVKQPSISNIKTFPSTKSLHFLTVFQRGMKEFSLIRFKYYAKKIHHSAFYFVDFMGMEPTYARGIGATKS